MKCPVILRNLSEKFRLFEAGRIVATLSGVLLLFGVCFAWAAEPAARAALPNIVVILCDDLGYGDVHAFNPDRCKIPTPHFDRLAGQSLVFTDAHSTSSVCTPSRYSLLTGRYNWRTVRQSGVGDGYSPPLIASGRLTLPALLKQHGYTTACIGKWHLGLGMAKNNDNKPDYSKPLLQGPTTCGFDYFYGISASLDMPPYIWIENDRFVGVPTVKKKYVREGDAHKDFEAMDVLPALVKKAVAFIGEQSSRNQRYFLYVPLTSPHTPIVPTPEWQGKSPIGLYGDFVMQTDAAVGEVMKAIENTPQADNTLLIVTSDNGYAPYAGMEIGPSRNAVRLVEAKGHFPSAGFRGYKADIWEGGHRIPFMARWPAVIKKPAASSQTICQSDLLATFADILGVKLPETAGEDSVSLLPLLRGENRPVREAIVHHSIHGRFAIRQGPWKLCLCPGSGGWASPTDAEARHQGLPAVQLYNLEKDPGETNNLQAQNPEIVRQLTALLERYVADGRSTLGAPQTNDARIHIMPNPTSPARQQ